jgi:FimV-like protein
MSITSLYTQFIEIFHANASIRAICLVSVLFILGAIILILFGSKQTQAKKKLVLMQNDVSAIAGENIAATQLDLAKAYIEMDQKDLAKQVLKQVTQQGDVAQKREAQQLIDIL